MSKRVLMDGNGPRVITSKPGYDASTSLADEYKTFDSNWFFGGGIKWHLTADSTTTSSVSFPYALDYSPAVVAMKVYDRGKKENEEMEKAMNLSGVEVPSTAKTIQLSGGYDVGEMANITSSGITNIPMQTNTFYNYVTHFFVMES